MAKKKEQKKPTMVLTEVGEEGLTEEQIKDICEQLGQSYVPPSEEDEL